jgi:hypothetical protein
MSAKEIMNAVPAEAVDNLPLNARRSTMGLQRPLITRMAVE